nr:MAG TPA: hypothetical protein [Caudoviricetes sp.]
MIGQTISRKNSQYITLHLLALQIIAHARRAVKGLAADYIAGDNHDTGGRRCVCVSVQLCGAPGVTLAERLQPVQIVKVVHHPGHIQKPPPVGGTPYAGALDGGPYIGHDTGRQIAHAGHIADNSAGFAVGPLNCYRCFSDAHGCAGNILDKHIFTPQSIAGVRLGQFPRLPVAFRV